MEELTAALEDFREALAGSGHGRFEKYRLLEREAEAMLSGTIVLHLKATSKSFNSIPIFAASSGPRPWSAGGRLRPCASGPITCRGSSSSGALTPSRPAR